MKIKSISIIVTFCLTLDLSAKPLTTATNATNQVKRIEITKQERIAMLHVLATFFLATIIEDGASRSQRATPDFYKGLLMGINMDGTPDSFKKDFKEYAWNFSQIAHTEYKEQSILFTKLMLEKYDIDMLALVKAWLEEFDQIELDTPEGLPPSTDEERAKYYKLHLDKIDKMRTNIVNRVMNIKSN